MIAGKTDSRSAEKTGGVSTRSTRKRRFTEEARRVGWIYAGVCAILASAGLWVGSAAGGLRGVLSYWAMRYFRPHSNAWPQERRTFIVGIVFLSRWRRGGRQWRRSIPISCSARWSASNYAF